MAQGSCLGFKSLSYLVNNSQLTLGRYLFCNLFYAENAKVRLWDAHFTNKEVLQRKRRGFGKKCDSPCPIWKEFRWQAKIPRKRKILLLFSWKIIGHPCVSTSLFSSFPSHIRPIGSLSLQSSVEVYRWVVPQTNSWTSSSLFAASSTPRHRPIGHLVVKIVTVMLVKHFKSFLAMCTDDTDCFSSWIESQHVSNLLRFIIFELSLWSEKRQWPKNQHVETCWHGQFHINFIAQLLHKGLIRC